MTKLYDYWRSSASYRVRIALGLAKEQWETCSVDLVSGEQTEPDYLALNPQGLVPVLEIDGRRLTQSLAQIEYLDETRHLGLLPEDPGDRATVRALAYAVAIDIHPICNVRVAKWVTGRTDITMEDWMARFIEPGLAALEQMVRGGDFTFGSSVTLADICLMPQIYNAERWKIPLERFPKLRRIHRNLERIPAFAAAHPDRAAEAAQ